MLDFMKFKTAVAAQWEHMQKYPMFRIDIEKDALWETYLRSFPPGTNPKFRERTEHDCSCCKQFVRAVGNVVAIIDGKVVSVWDVNVNDSAYQRVTNAMAELTSHHRITEPFLHYERTAGTDKNFEQMVDGTQTWQHFFVNIQRDFVKNKADIPSLLGEERSTYDVFKRSLETITNEACESVVEITMQGSLYRGTEHLHAVEAFHRLKVQFASLSPDIDNNTFLWTVYKTVPASVSHIRNTAIGTLLVDLSEGKELEEAVRAFEIKVAGLNYKRPTALVTKKMIENAKVTVEELGLTSALERRYATINDITINNVLFADRTARKSMGVFDTLSPTARAKVQNLDKMEEVPIEKFITDILPRIESMEVLVENGHTSNLVSLIAPVDPTAGPLFKWPNNFSWSYNGEMADSVKERVKKAGGNVEGDLCCRLAWYNYDDLDLHIDEPDGGHIYFGNKRSPHGGALDVDMNAGGGRTREPVENIYYGMRRRMLEGVYTLSVNQFAKRETSDVGFEVEIDYLGAVHRFVFDKSVSGIVQVAKFQYTHKDGFNLLESLPTSLGSPRKVWGVPTQDFVKVETIMMSPNYWDDRYVGNKHYFFMLEGCANDTTARGFYNEFLDSRLDKHSKVFEMIGSKLKPEPSDKQLSGLGFSSTQRNTLLCRVKGSYSRVLKLVF